MRVLGFGPSSPALVHIYHADGATKIPQRFRTKSAYCYAGSQLLSPACLCSSTGGQKFLLVSIEIVPPGIDDLFIITKLPWSRLPGATVQRNYPYSRFIIKCMHDDALPVPLVRHSVLYVRIQYEYRGVHYSTGTLQRPLYGHNHNTV